MKILVVSRKFIEKNIPTLIDEQVISIFSSSTASEKDFSPFKSDRKNILKLQFDDIEEKDPKLPTLILFNENHAKQINEFIKTLDTSKMLFIHCDAGISRSGAVGDVLNLFFNQFKEKNKKDDLFFQNENSQIFPNHLVKRLLFNELFMDEIYTNKENDQMKVNDEVWCLIDSHNELLRKHLISAYVVEKAIFKGVDDYNKNFGFIKLPNDVYQKYPLNFIPMENIFINEKDALSEAKKLNEEASNEINNVVKELEKINK